MTRHHAAIILTAMLVGSLAVGIWHDHRDPTPQNWFETLLAGLEVMAT